MVAFRGRRGVSSRDLGGHVGQLGAPMDHKRSWAKALAAVLALLVLPACTPVGDPTATLATSAPTSASTTPTTAATSPSTDPAVAEATQEVLDAYRGYWAAKVASYADPSKDQDPNLAVYAIDTALTDAQATLASMRHDGIYVPGEPVLDPEVSDVDLAASTATVTDCVDTSNWQPLFVASDESAAAPGQSTRVLATATASVYGGRWVIAAYAVERDRTC